MKYSYILNGAVVAVGLNYGLGMSMETSMIAGMVTTAYMMRYV